MHQVIESGLEEYLEGRSTREFETHIAQCLECREQLSEVRNVSAMLAGLRSDSAPTPSLGFQARVLRGVQQRKKQSIWGLFSIEPAFAGKLALGSLLGLAVLGGYLITDPTDSMAQADHTPEAVMASHDTTSPDAQQHQNGMLVTLATYHQ